MIAAATELIECSKLNSISKSPQESPAPKSQSIDCGDIRKNDEESKVTWANNLRRRLSAQPSSVFHMGQNFHKKLSREDSQKSVVHASDIFLKTEIHGFPDVYNASNLSKRILWMIVLVLAGGCMIYGLYRSLEDFLEMPILTTYSIVTPKGGMPFPDLFICPRITVNMSRVRQEFGKDNFLEKSGMQDNGGLISGTPGKILQSQVKIFQSYKIERLWNNVNNFSMPMSLSEFYREYGIQKGEFIKECKFENSPVNCTDISTTYFDPRFGNCFVVHMNRAQTEEYNGLSIVLDLDLNRTLDKNDLTLTDGIYLQAVMDYTMGPKHSTVLATGYHWQVHLSAERLHLVNDPNQIGGQECQEEEENIDFKVMKGEYNVDTCQIDCIQNEIIGNAQCYVAMDAKFIQALIFDKYPECKYEQLVAGLNIMSDGDSFDRFKSCRDKCSARVPCEDWTFKTNQMFLPFPSDNWRSVISEDRFKSYRNSYVILDIQFPSLNYIDIKQEHSMTFNTFVSNIGGQVGLWLGASIVTLIKFFIVLIQVIEMSIVRRRQRKHGEEIEADLEYQNCNENNANTIEPIEVVVSENSLNVDSNFNQINGQNPPHFDL